MPSSTSAELLLLVACWTHLITEVVDVCIILHLHDVVIRLSDAIRWRRVVASATAPRPSSPLGSVGIVHLVTVLRSPSHGRVSISSAPFGCSGREINAWTRRNIECVMTDCARGTYVNTNDNTAVYQ